MEFGFEVMEAILLHEGENVARVDAVLWNDGFGELDVIATTAQGVWSRIEKHNEFLLEHEAGAMRIQFVDEAFEHNSFVRLSFRRVGGFYPA